jgi:hypothetical protein
MLSQHPSLQFCSCSLTVRYLVNIPAQLMCIIPSIPLACPADSMCTLHNQKSSQAVCCGGAMSEYWKAESWCQMMRQEIVYLCVGCGCANALYQHVKATG